MTKATMYMTFMKVQWKWTRLAALICVVVGFAIPIFSVQGLRRYGGAYGSLPGNLVREMEQYGVLYAMLAAGSGLAFALLAWNADHRGRHVYSLSLPISRSRYAGMRFANGTLFLLAPTLAVLIGCYVAIASAAIPDGLHAYPIALTIRFFLSSLVVFALFSAISSSSQRVSSAIVGTLIGVVVLAILMGMMGIRNNLLGQLGSVLFADPGVLSVLTGRWMLIDV